MASYLHFNKYYKFNNTIMSKGTVKFFNESKGFGFITEEGVEKDHFVHISGLIDEINEGDNVEFDLQEGNKGLNAVNVKVI
jgi:CspA family cold shock protein